MSATTRRRPLPAVAFLLALTVLTAIVWWRVLNRSNQDEAAGSPAGTTSPIRCTGGKPVALPAPKAVTVYIFNGNGATGLAAKVDAELKSRGFTSAGHGDNPAGTISGVAEIRFGSSAKAAASLLSFYLPGAKLMTISRPDARVDLVLGSGYKALASPTVVNKSVANAKKPC